MARKKEAAPDAYEHAAIVAMKDDRIRELESLVLKLEAKHIEQLQDRNLNHSREISELTQLMAQHASAHHAEIQVFRHQKLAYEKMIALMHATAIKVTTAPGMTAAVVDAQKAVDKM